MPRQGSSGAFILLAAGLLLTHEAAWAADALPYSQRTRSYGTNDATARGDLRTVGMSGAVIGLADTSIASLDNPAGQAMTLHLGDLNFASNELHDRNIQNYDAPVVTSHFGLALSPYPWGVGVALVTPYSEGQQYQLPSAGGQVGRLSVVAQEFQLSGSRVFMNNRFAAGATLRFGTAVEEIDVIGPHRSGTPAIGATIGVMGQLNDRVLLGMSFATPMVYNFDGVGQPSELPGFFRNLQSPYRISFGAGWIPNRYIRLGSSLNIIGPTPGAALLKDERIAVGQGITPQPRFGFNYVFADYRDFEGQIFGGMYLEISRIQDAPSRLHVTSGIELKPWILALGAGVDLSANYSNFIIGAGINVIKTMEKLDLIPKMYSPQRRGIVKSPFFNSDEGLARPLVANWNPQGPAVDPIQMVLDLPKKIETKIEKISEPFQSKKIAPKKKAKKRTANN